jgi:hypothetical protein
MSGAGGLNANMPLPTVPVDNPASGQIDQGWYRFFLALWNRGGGGTGALAMPGGADGDVQFNNAGTFGGLTDEELTERFDFEVLDLNGNSVAPTAAITFVGVVVSGTSPDAVVDLTAIAGVKGITGGAVSFTGGTSTGSGEIGGAVAIAGGTSGGGAAGAPVNISGSAGNGSHVGGEINLTGGNSGTGSVGNGGAVNVTGGSALSTNGVGGGFNLVGGNSTGTRAGGSAVFGGGHGGNTSGAGGEASILGGTGGGTGNGGAVTIQAGPGGVSNGAGGQTNIYGGVGTGSGDGGDVVLSPGPGAANGSIQAAGLLQLTSGTPTISGGSTIAGTDQSGLVTVGSSPTTSVAITFGGAYPAAPKGVTLTPANSTAAATGTTGAYVSAVSPTAFTITGLALASAAYYYHAI